METTARKFMYDISMQRKSPNKINIVKRAFTRGCTKASEAAEKTGMTVI